MTWSILLDNLKAWFPVVPRQTAPAEPTAPVRQNTVKLTGMLIITVQRHDQTAFKFMATEVGERKVVFKSTVLMNVGEKLQVEMLLPGSGALRAPAVVDWTLQSRSGCTGQLSLDTTPEQERLLSEFVQRQRDRRR